VKNARPHAQNSWNRKPAVITGTSPGALGTAVAKQHLRQLGGLGMPSGAGRRMSPSKPRPQTVRSRMKAWLSSWTALSTGWRRSWPGLAIRSGWRRDRARAVGTACGVSHWVRAGASHRAGRARPRMIDSVTRAVQHWPVGLATQAFRDYMPATDANPTMNCQSALPRRQRGMILRGDACAPGSGRAKSEIADKYRNAAPGFRRHARRTTSWVTQRVNDALTA
jgi:hypothetical protein